MPFIIGYFFLIFFFSFGVYAQVPLSTALSLAPPTTDLSLVYLATIFGTIEGVLSSSGSQIFGHMMSVLNLSVMALGSIVIMYTLIVGTLNTAHEGEFLGKHWSSIWLPVRATVGMTLLVPKTSGYCLMQVLVMWVVVQGVGAADKLWGSALDYLAMGGKLVQALPGSTAVEGKSESNPAYNGAATILIGQVCAYSIQKQLEALRTTYLNDANPTDGSDPKGPCAPNVLEKGSKMDDFCNNPVPDFLDDMNAINISSQNKNANEWEMPIPYFSGASTPNLYKSLSAEAICGKVKWANIQSTEQNSLDSAKESLQLNDAQMDSLIYARSIGIQQMIEFLSPVARAMVDNDPQINTNLTETLAASSVAVSQYGVTLDNYGNVCTSRYSCQNWNAVPSTSPSVLFAGNEMFNAVNAYQGVMQPVLNLLRHPSNSDADFIKKAKKDGWFFAGGYYFDMIVLSGSPGMQSVIIDSKSDLGSSTIYKLELCSGSSNTLCTFLTQGDANAMIDKTNNLIAGSSLLDNNNSVCQADLNYHYSTSAAPNTGYVSGTGENPSFSDLPCSSTTMGYIGNSFYLVIPGQQNLTGPMFQMPSIALFNFRMPHKKQIDFNSCRPKINFIFFKVCMGWLFNGFLSAVTFGINIVLQVVIMLFKLSISWFFIPLLIYFFSTLQDAFLYLTEMSHNPIVNLANMGAGLIEMAGNIFLGLSSVSFLVAANPAIGQAILALLAILLPLVLVWIGYFFTIGFLAAYYVPVYPFIIFTFGSIAWLMAVIEAIIAAPIVALGVMSPEGEGILGKSETGMMILVNVFLRPSMMILGYVIGIMLTYVSIWIVNYQFDYIAGFITDPAGNPSDHPAIKAGIKFDMALWTQIFGYSAYLGIYVSLYITLVQKSFTLIFNLPDKILRWIGAQQEAFGQEIQHWAEESKQKTEQLAQAVERGWGEGNKGQAAKDVTAKMKGEGSGSIQGGK